MRSIAEVVHSTICTVNRHGELTFLFEPYGAKRTDFGLIMIEAQRSVIVSGLTYRNCIVES